MKPRLLIELARNRKPAETLLAGILDENPAASLAAGQKLVAEAKQYGLSLSNYLRLAIDTEKGEYKGSKLDGYEAALAYLGLPLRDDFKNGVVLQAAAETFNTYPGSRGLFSEVMDDIVQYKYRQDQIESVDPMISQSRTINGVEMITEVIDDKAADYQSYGIIAEGSRIPVRSIRTTEKSVKFHKFGGGIETTYEFERRISLDLLTPYAARMQREVSIGQTTIATNLLVNGDGTANNAAAAVVTATTLAGQMPAPPTIVAGKLNWEIFLRWLMNRAKAGVPVDTVVGNYDLWFEWQRMFATPQANAGMTQGDILAKAGVDVAIANPRFDFNVTFAVASQAPAGKLIGFRKAETLEELVESGSDIEESVRAIENQKVRYVRTENKGYRLVFGDTREILNLV